MPSSSSRPTYSVVIPVYNSVESLGELADRLHAVFTDVVKAPYELIFVDDASPNPETWPALEAVWERHERVQIIRLSRNFGQHSATLCGINHSVGNWVITMDDDLQQLPEDIPALLEQQHHDIVIAQLVGRQHSLWKRATSWLKGGFDRFLLGRPKGLRLSSFRVLSRLVADGVCRIRTPYPFIPGMMFHISKDVVGVPARHLARAHGRSGYSLLRLIRLFSNLVISNSSLLLRLVGYSGMLFAGGSIAMAMYFAGRKLAYGSPVSGWTSLIVAILLVGGLVMFALGIIGEYLIRIIAGTENKPTFFERTHHDLRDAPDARVPVVAELRSESSRAGGG